MPSSFTSLPVELSTIIIDEVDSRDISSLRLTCSRLRSTTLYRFRQAFTHRTTNMSSKSLQALTAICEHEDLGPAIRSLTIVAACYDTTFLQKVLDTKRPYKKYNEEHGPVVRENHKPCTREELNTVATQHNLLIRRKADQAKVAASKSDLMQLTATLQTASNLRTITLEAGLYHYPEIRVAASQSRGAWAEVWKRALHVYSVTMTALAQSKLRIEELHIYGGKRGCSVPAYDMHRLMPDLLAKGLKEVLVQLRVLSLNYATRLLEAERPFGVKGFQGYPRRIEESNTKLVSLATDKRNYLGPAYFLSLCPNLQELDIGYYALRVPEWCSSGDFSAYWGGYENVFDQFTNSVRLPKLLKCKIRGQSIRQHALLQLLKDSSRLETLELRFVTLVEGGSWGTIFDQCRHLDSLILLRLFQGNRSVLTRRDHQRGPGYKLTAGSDRLRNGIEYTTPDWEPNSPWIHAYSRMKQREHGPPKHIPTIGYGASL